MSVLDKYIEKYTNVGMNMIDALIIFILGWYLVKIVLHFLSKMMKRSKVDPIIENFLLSILNVGLKVIVVITVIAELGVPTTSLVAVLTTAGAAIALGIQDSMKGIVSGFTILFSKPFTKGDIIEIDNYVGTVQEIQLLYTILMTFDNKMVVIPNNELVSSSFVNYSHEDIRRVTITFDIHYQNDVEQLKTAIMEVIEKQPHALKDPAPYIKISEYKEQSLTLAIWVWAKNEYVYELNDQLLLQIKHLFDRYHVVMPMKRLDVYVHREDEKGISNK